MKSLSLSLALRYLCSHRQGKNISIMTAICFVGIAIGSFALMLTLIITNGFEYEIHKKMKGINASLIMKLPGKNVDPDKIREALATTFSEEVEACTGSSSGQIIIEKDHDQALLFMKGVEPAYEQSVSTLHTKIIEAIDTKRTLESLLQGNGILIGYKTAATFNLAVGDHINLLVPEPGGKRKITLTKKKGRIAGIFNIGLDEYDSNFAFCALPFLCELFDTKGVETIAIKMRESSSWFERLWGEQHNERALISCLKKFFPSFTIYSWKDLYPAIVSSLKLEKYVMFFILALICLVASMNMISLLFIQIQTKIRNIAILHALGMPHTAIRNLFLSLGMSITIAGSLCGLAAAAAVGYALEKYPFIELPDVYYVSHLPAKMHPELFGIVFLCTLLLGFLATFIAARQTKYIHIVQVLRSSS